MSAQQQSGETRPRDAHGILQEWTTGARWRGIERPYSADDVVRLRGSIQIEHTLANWAPTGCGPSFMTSLTSPPSARSPATRRCSR